jgi:hypothetical protein
MKKIKKKHIIIGSIILLLLIGRMTLPYFVTKFVNKVLADIPGYSGSISGVDIWLIRGAYTINGLQLYKVDGNEKIPFIDIPVTDLSVEWKAIFKGAIVGEVVFEKPTLNFIGGNESKNTENQSGADVDWTAPLKKLMPLQINRLEIVNGNIKFFDFTSKPEVDLNLYNLNLLASNLNNASRHSEPLPSKVNASATSIGDGRLHLEMDINVLKKIPDLDMDLKFEDINMPALNDFFLAYAKVDIERGTFNLYTELAVNDGKISGYIKPLAQNIKVVNWEEDKRKPIKLIWEGIVSFFVEIFENQKEDQFASKVPLAGDLNNVDTSILPSLFAVLQNAFVQAFEKDTDNTIFFNKNEKAEEK